MAGDTASFIRSTSGVTVTLGAPNPQNVGGSIGLITLIGIENLAGSNFNDTLAGNAGNNILNGGAGIDTADYSLASAGVTVSLAIAAPQNTGGAGIGTRAAVLRRGARRARGGRGDEREAVVAEHPHAARVRAQVTNRSAGLPAGGGQQPSA